MKMQIVFENDQFLIVDKPAGIVVNRSETIREETLQDQLAVYLKLAKRDLGIGDRVGIVHRLDRETSGLLIVAKTNAAFDNLQNQFKMRQVKKEYLALVHGAVDKKAGEIEVSLVRAGKFGKFAVAKLRDKDARETFTEYEVIKNYEFNNQKFESIIGKMRLTKSRINYLKNHAKYCTFVKVRPRTGRTHQIRVVLKHIGHPVVSDAIYTPAKLLKFDLAWCPRLFLHSSFIEFYDPKSKKQIAFNSTLPKELDGTLALLDN